MEYCNTMGNDDTHFVLSQWSVRTSKEKEKYHVLVLFIFDNIITAAAVSNV